MKVTLSALAHSVRGAYGALGITVSTGHAQQLIAAALGHKTLASLQSAGDHEALPETKSIVVDLDLLAERARALDLADQQAVDVVWSALEDHLPGEVYGSVTGLVESHQEFVELETWNDGDVGSQMAMTNGTGPGETYMPLEFDESEFDLDGDLELQIFGHVNLDQDPDKVFYGTHIDVEATLTVERFGRFLFGSSKLEVTSASLRWMNEDPEDPQP